MQPSSIFQYILSLSILCFAPANSHSPPQLSPGDLHGHESAPPALGNQTNLDFNILFGRQEALSAPGQSGGSSSSSSSGDYTCGPGKPCGNGACCGKDGWCGYGPKYCGDGCQSNCDAKAECGKYASSPGKGCPLNVCCSQYGFCGTTSEFCGEGCQSHCKQPKPSAGSSNTQTRVVAYYEGWSLNRPCGGMAPEEIPVLSVTHLIFAFGFIEPDSFRITKMDEVKSEIIERVANLKERNPSLKIMIALGGWTFNDPGKWQKVFSSVASSSTNRMKFIDNLIGFLNQYGFDGADIDWEYPGADDRGGVEEDGENFTALLKDMKAAFNKDPHKYLLTYTAPTSYWYLRHFDLTAMTQHVDWINLMSYDLHGVWDRDNPIGSQVLAHTNLTEIDLALDLFWRNDIEPRKIVLGMGFYGRSFKLSNGNCWKPGCQFSGPGDGGRCTKTDGILSYMEIDDIIKSTNAKPHYDDDAKVNYLVYGQNNWISYDDPKTIKTKIDYANKMGLGGLMTWAIDLDNAKGDLLSAMSGKATANPDDILQFMNDDGPSISQSTDDPSRCIVTDCMKGDGSDVACPEGYTPMTRKNSKDGKRCDTGDSRKARWVCCPSFAAPDPDQCHWADQRSNVAHTDCNGKCDVGEIQVAGDSFGWDKEKNRYGDRCLRGGKVFCCKAGNMEQYLKICEWQECNKDCPSNMPHKLTTDSGGPKANKRCPSPNTPPGGGGTPFDPVPEPGRRKLCCPKPDSLKNCGWKSGGYCSESCGENQITIDTDPQGPGGRTCDNGREQSYCCDPPGGTNRPFTPFDLDTLFPPAELPPPDAIPKYDLISFHGAVGIGIDDPNLSGVAFFLISGSSTALSSMEKRESGDGMEFLDCPADITTAPLEKHLTARVICIGNTEDCFAVRKGGVEGTIVKMPPECGETTSFARAVSLTLSKNQSIPDSVALKNPTSAVFDFVFDYNIALARRDSGAFGIRIDYSNVAGYWDKVVKSPGVLKKRDVSEDDESTGNAEKRFFSGQSSLAYSKQAWWDKFDGLSFNPNQANNVKEDLKTLLFNEGQMCDVGNGVNAGEGISIGIEGTLDTKNYYGFSMIARWFPSSVVRVYQAAGFYRAEGTQDVNFEVGGRGALDIGQALQGDTWAKNVTTHATSGHQLFRGWVSFTPYVQTGVKLRTEGGKNGRVQFDAHMTGRIKSNFGKVTLHYPNENPITPYPGNEEGQKPDNQLSLGDSHWINPLGDYPTGKITVTSSVRLGLQVGLHFKDGFEGATPDPMPDMSVVQETFAQFSLGESNSEACVATSMGSTSRSVLANGGSVAGWSNGYSSVFSHELASAGNKQCSAPTTRRLKKRANKTYPWDPEIPTIDDNLGNQFNHEIRLMPCGNCMECADISLAPPCCGCSWLSPDDLEENPQPDSSDVIFNPQAIAKRTSVVVRKTVSESGTNDDSEVGIPDTFSRRSLHLDSSGDYKVIPDITPPIRSEGTALSERSDNVTLVNLEERADPSQPGLSVKTSYFCTKPVKTDQYPAYPDYKTKPNTPVDFDRWFPSLATKYYHNATQKCGDWDVSQFNQADQIFWNPVTDRPSIVPFHQTYQTEHVFETQTVTRFINRIVQRGRNPGDLRFERQRSCAWIYYWMTKTDNEWNGQSFASKVMAEFGSINHLERLTLLLSRPNRMKGSLFSGNTPLSLSRFNSYPTPDKQFLAAREIGMVFTYLQRPEVWTAFCDTFLGIRSLMQQFDGFHNGQQDPVGGENIPTNLGAEWEFFVQEELDNIVDKARDALQLMYDNRKQPLHPNWLIRWLVVRYGGDRGVALPGTSGVQWNKLWLPTTASCHG